VLALTLAGCNSWPRSLHYRFTVEVENDGKLVSGSAVQEEYCTFNDGLLKGLGNDFNCGVRGEAVVVDLGSKGLLFVLMIKDLKRKSAPPYGLFEDAIRSTTFTAKVFDKIAALRGPISTPPATLPQLVRFHDLNNPRDMESVDPVDLSATYGPGVALKAAWLEITSDPISIGIEERMPPWFVEARAKRTHLDGNTEVAHDIWAPLSGTLGTDAFQKD
jgi:hypothetical protein